jgi:hypothetical protein
LVFFINCQPAKRLLSERAEIDEMSMSNLQAAESVEGRLSLRARSLRTGKVVFGSSQYSRNCVIRDTSEGGCRIRIDDPDSIPAEFWLLDIKKFSAFKAQVKWRKGNELGLALGSECPLDGSEKLEINMLRKLAIEAKVRLGA